MSTYQPDDKRVRQMAWEIANEESARNKNVVHIADVLPPPRVDTPLRTYCAADLDGKTIPAREWLVEGVMPHRNVTLLSGDGGIGKSLLALNLFAHIAARMDWLGFKTMQGPVLYVGAEDEKEEIERRIESIRQGLGVASGELCDLHYLSLAGEDALLGVFDRAANKMMPTRLFERLQDRVCNLGSNQVAQSRGLREGFHRKGVVCG